MLEMPQLPSSAAKGSPMIGTPATENDEIPSPLLCKNQNAEEALEKPNTRSALTLVSTVLLCK